MNKCNLLLAFLTSCIISCALPISEDFKKLSPKLASKKLMQQYAPIIEQRYMHAFEKQDIHYPPSQLAILGFKTEQRVEVWAKNKKGPWKHVKNYPLLARSGKPGPKLLQDDEQIPEGIYKISFLNPFSQLHLSMKLNYPNAFDRYYAKLDKRKKLGGDIFIHGKNLSVGCLAIGDVAIEELYIMTAKTGITRTEVIVSSNDLRYKTPNNMSAPVAWVSNLDKQLKKALTRFT